MENNNSRPLNQPMADMRPASSPPPPQKPPFFTPQLLRRVLTVALPPLLGILCSLLPPNAQGICRAAATVGQQVVIEIASHEPTPSPSFTSPADAGQPALEETLR